jgi:hypothetical protein
MLQVYENLNCLMSDWTLHSMNNNIVYEESFNSTKKTRVSREANNAIIEDQRFYWLIVRMMILRQSKRRRTLFRRRKFDVLIESI